MTVPKRVSTVWALPPLVFEVIKGLTFQRTPQATGKVEVAFGARLPVAGGELVVVSGKTQQPTREFVTGGTPGKDEQVDVFVHLYTNLPGFDELRTWSRMQQLGTVIDEGFRDLSTGRPFWPASMSAVGVRSLTCSPTQTAVYPAGSAGAQGWMGEAEIVISTTSRI